MDPLDLNLDESDFFFFFAELCFYSLNALHTSCVKIITEHTRGGGGSEMFGSAKYQLTWITGWSKDAVWSNKSGVNTRSTIYHFCQTKKKKNFTG